MVTAPKGSNMILKRISILIAASITLSANDAPAAREMTIQEEIDYHGQRCQQGSGEDCKLLADILCDKTADILDLPAAFQFYERGCKLKDQASCFHLAYAYSEGHGVRQDYFKAAAIDRTNCTAGYSASCYNLGVSYQNGHGVRKDKHKAQELYGRACDLQYQHGCDAYAKLYQEGY